MTGHLAECPLIKPCCLHCMAECICAALRACEDRVLDSARDAVSALRGCIGTDDSGDGTVWLEKIDALSAIDALKEKK